LGEFKHYKTRLDHGGISKEVSVLELTNISFSFVFSFPFLYLYAGAKSFELNRVCSALCLEKNVQLSYFDLFDDKFTDIQSELTCVLPSFNTC
jgi:hypothetical protein